MMNSLYENRNSVTTTIEKPKHLVCEGCNANWLGYLVHEDNCSKK